MKSIDEITLNMVWVLIVLMVVLFYFLNRDDDDRVEM
jgi:hypothetical protein